MEPNGKALELKIVNKNYPWNLLLLADPSRKVVKEYLKMSTCYVALRGNNRVGVAVIQDKGNGIFELTNIAVSPNNQNQGYGTWILRSLIDSLKNTAATKLVVGTGTFGYQLKFYQKIGFRVEMIRKNYFLDNYEKPIFEDDLQHRDMLVLGLQL